MLTRRRLIYSAAFFASAHSLAVAQNSSEGEVTFDQLTFPAFEAIDAPTKFGYDEPTEAQKAKAKAIINDTPKGPAPIVIAQSFVDRFATSDPAAISQWPAPAAWNPLVVAFFGVTSTKANNDMIAWCAAFANWCIERSGQNGSRSASSQSFLSPNFKHAIDPMPGDLAVFTCYDEATGKSVGLGHVTFFKQRLSDNSIICVGGNQSADGHSSIISERVFSTVPRIVRRHIDNRYVPTTMKLNTYIRLS